MRGKRERGGKEKETGSKVVYTRREKGGKEKEREGKEKGHGSIREVDGKKKKRIKDNMSEG